jgi:hypothetical protein
MFSVSEWATWGHDVGSHARLLQQQENGTADVQRWHQAREWLLF